MKKLISVVMSLALLLTSAGVFFSGSDVKGAAAESCFINGLLFNK